MQKSGKKSWIKRLCGFLVAVLIVSDMVSYSMIPVFAEKQTLESTETGTETELSEMETEVTEAVAAEPETEVTEAATEATETKDSETTAKETTKTTKKALARTAGVATAQTLSLEAEDAFDFRSKVAYSDVFSNGAYVGAFTAMTAANQSAVNLTEGGYVQWSVTAEEAMNAKVSLSFARASGTSTVGLIVNGIYIQTLTLTGAGATVLASTAEVSIALQAGQNDIVITAPTSVTAQPSYDALNIAYTSATSLVKTFTRFEAEEAYGGGTVKSNSSVADDQYSSKWGYRQFTKTLSEVPASADGLTADTSAIWILNSEEDLDNVNLVVGYGNANTANPGSFGVYVQPLGGEVTSHTVSASTLPYIVRANRSAITVDLKAGVNIIYVSALTTGTYNLDYIEVAANGVSVTAVNAEDLAAMQESTGFEAENAFVYKGKYRGGTAGEGYSGLGFVSNLNKQTSASVAAGTLTDGGYVEWSVMADRTTPAYVSLTYTSTIADSIGLVVNGAFLKNVTLSATETGTRQTTEKVLVLLKEGLNTITFTGSYASATSLEMDALNVSYFTENTLTKAYTRLEAEAAVGGGSVSSGDLSETLDINWFSGASYRSGIAKPDTIPQTSAGLTSSQYVKWTVYAPKDMENVDIAVGYATTTPTEIGVYVQNSDGTEQAFTAAIANTGYWARAGRTTVSGVNLKEGINYILVSGCSSAYIGSWCNLDYIDILTGAADLKTAVTSRLEAEEAQVIRATVESSASFSGSSYVGNMLALTQEYTAVADMENTGNIRFNFDSDVAMEADISLAYKSSSAQPAVEVFLNDEYLGLYAITPNSSAVGTYVISGLPIQAGKNTLVVTAPVKGTSVGSDSAWVNYDYVDICGMETVNFLWDKENTDGIYQAEDQTVIRANIKDDGTQNVYNIANDSRANYESKLEFHVQAETDGIYYMTVRHRVDKYTNGWPAHEITVTNSGGATASCFDTSGKYPVLNIATVNTNPQVYSPVLYYDDPSIGTWYDSTVQVYLKAGENLITFRKPTCYTDASSGSSINFADVAIDYIKLEAENPNTNPPDFTDDMTSLDKLYSHTAGISVSGDGCALQNTDTGNGDENYIVYKMDEDITGFRLLWAVNEQDYYGTISVSADGTNWTKVETAKTPKLYMGSWIWKRTVVTSEGGIPSGMRYLRIQFPLVRQQNNFNTLNDSWYFQLHNVDIWTGQTQGLSVTTPESYQIIQRDDNDKADVTVSGVAVGVANVSVTLYQKQVNGDGTRGAAVSGFTGITGTVGSQSTYSVDLKQVPAGLYDIVVSAAGCTDVELTDVGIGDLWIIAGQSNSAGNAQVIEGEDVHDDAAEGVSVFYPDLQYWQQGKQPMGENKGQPVYSSFGLAFAKDVMAKTGVPVGIFHTGVGGTSIQRWSLNAKCTGGENNGFLYKYQLLSCFENGKNDFHIAGILWNQGTTDCSDSSMLNAVTVNGTTFESKYEYLLYNLIRQMRSDFGNDITIIVNQIAKSGTLYSTVEQLSASDKAWGIVRNAQREIENLYNNDRVYSVPTSDGILWDNWLHNSAGSNLILSARMADIALKYHYNMSAYQEKEVLYPNIESATQTGEKTILLTFNHTDGVIFTGSDFKDEFSVLDAAENKSTIESAEIVGDGKNQILLTLADAVPAGAVVNGLSACYLGNTIKMKTKANNVPMLSFAYVEVESVAKIAMSTLPKTTYSKGKTLDVSGGKLKVTYADGSTDTLALTEDMVYDFSSKKAGKTDLTVSYGGQITTYKVTIQ